MYENDAIKTVDTKDTKKNGILNDYFKDKLQKYLDNNWGEDKLC